jgi:uncharacterized membrane protein
MKRLLLIPALLPLAACASSPRPYNPVSDVRYSALGANPYWQLSIGGDRIVFRLAPDPGAAPQPRERVFPRTLPRAWEGVTSWQSEANGAGITVEARPGPCEASGRTWRDAVTVRIDGRELSGCGGPLLSGREG